ncbi:MAG: cell division protein FtsA [Alphaproteobacteria bacterium]|nr:cell division protein FtsA [Alphaproteobacteria bacterium]
MIGRFGKRFGSDKGLYPVKPGIIGALDVGSTKVACFIVKADNSRISGQSNLRVLGIGHQVSRGVRAGTVVDMDAAEEAIRAAVEQAEDMAGITLRDAIIGISCGQPTTRTIRVEVSIAGHEVGAQDLRQAHQHGREQIASGDREVVYCAPGSYSIDGSRGIRDPRGMYGDRLGVSMHVVTAAQSPIRNLETCVQRCHLDVAGKVVVPYASGLASLVADEMDLGVTVLDMGGGTTSIGVFFDGNLIMADVLPIGGNHITMDLARGLSTTLAHAERMKTLYGSALSSPTDAQEIMTIPQVGEDDPDAVSHLPRSVLTGIITPRLEETFELVRDRLQESGLESIAGRRVVLTGGASQLNGAREIAARILSKQVRLGRPARIAGLAEAAGGAAFSTCAGLAQWAASRTNELIEDGEVEDVLPVRAYGTYGFAGITRWFRDNF